MEFIQPNYPHNHIFTPNPDQGDYMGGYGLAAKNPFWHAFKKAFSTLRFPFYMPFSEARKWSLGLVVETIYSVLSSEPVN